jgi:hypothetical protein
MSLETFSNSKGIVRFILAAVLVLCCGALLWVNLLLQKENKQLAEQVSSMSAAEGPPVGSTIQILHGTDITGKNMTIDLGKQDHQTLLFALSPVCPYCKANFHNWRDLTSMVPADQVVWVDLTGKVDENYLRSVAIPLDANVIRLAPEERTLYSLSVTPITVLLGPHGVVRWAWPSVLSADKVHQLRALIHAQTS